MGRITSKDKYDLVIPLYICFHCRKEIEDQSTPYEISQIKHDSERPVVERYMLVFKSNTQYKRILFHPQCFEEVAGEDYCFSEDD